MMNKSIDTLLAEARTIRQETAPAENTAERVGAMLTNIVRKLEELKSDLTMLEASLSAEIARQARMAVSREAVIAADLENEIEARKQAVRQMQASFTALVAEEQSLRTRAIQLLEQRLDMELAAERLARLSGDTALRSELYGTVGEEAEARREAIETLRNALQSLADSQTRTEARMSLLDLRLAILLGDVQDMAMSQATRIDIVPITQAGYDALAEPSARTLYVIVDEAGTAAGTVPVASPSAWAFEAGGGTVDVRVASDAWTAD